MANSKIAVTVEINAEKIEKLFDALKGLQTYKLAENDDRTLVDTDDVAEVLADYITTYTEQKTERWIPVTERLPAYGEDVLISIGGYCNVGYVVPVNEEERYNWYFSGWYHSPNDVMAWMPLPEPFKEE